MTQTPSRDWQKHLTIHNKFEDGSCLVSSETLEELFSAYESKKDTAKIYREQALLQMRERRKEKKRADAAEAREQQLKEAVQLAVNDLGPWGDKILAAKVTLGQLQRTLSTLYPDTPAPAAPTPGITASPIDEWHEDYGDALWWTFPIQEPPYCGSPLDVDWPNYHTHWTPLVLPAAPKEGNTDENL